MFIKLVRSLARTEQRQRRIVRSLGLRGKINQIVEVKECPSIMGMIEKVNHLIEVQK